MAPTCTLAGCRLTISLLYAVDPAEATSEFDTLYSPYPHEHDDSHPTLRSESTGGNWLCFWGEIDFADGV